ncbi:MAG: DUF1214 domain-containing protein [Rhizobiales bacterium]|nr:DUF1214 domain-containing protein [Hyphomicrobiales bacterium]
MRPVGLIRYRKRPPEALRFLVNFAILVVVALVTGIGSAWYAISAGTPLWVRKIGPWTVWAAAGRVDADPYTRAYIARSGRLPVTSTSALYYFATTDSDGRRLDADCTYQIEGRGPNAEWWSLTAYDLNGQLMRTVAERYSLNGSALLRDHSGNYKIFLAREPVPGNWLPTGGDSRMQLVLRVYRPTYRADERTSSEEAAELPSIRRLKC